MRSIRPDLTTSIEKQRRRAGAGNPRRIALRRRGALACSSTSTATRFPLATRPSQAHAAHRHRATPAIPAPGAAPPGRVNATRAAQRRSDPGHRPVMPSRARGRRARRDDSRSSMLPRLARAGASDSHHVAISVANDHASDEALLGQGARCACTRRIGSSRRQPHRLDARHPQTTQPHKQPVRARPWPAPPASAAPGGPSPACLAPHRVDSHPIGRRTRPANHYWRFAARLPCGRRPSSAIYRPPYLHPVPRITGIPQV